jgi:hypothetical protein
MPGDNAASISLPANAPTAPPMAAPDSVPPRIEMPLPSSALPTASPAMPRTRDAILIFFLHKQKRRPDGPPFRKFILETSYVNASLPDVMIL